jgi:hypothetical protein
MPGNEVCRFAIVLPLTIFASARRVKPWAFGELHLATQRLPLSANEGGPWVWLYCEEKGDFPGLLRESRLNGVPRNQMARPCGMKQGLSDMGREPELRDF